MARKTHEVQRIVTRGQNPGDVLEKVLDEGASAGKQLVQVIPLFDEILLLWQKPTREQRG